jgi:hypothetical protein
MGKRGQAQTTPPRAEDETQECGLRLPAPSASYRRRAWVKFQRALDPLAPIKPLPPPRS